MDMSLGTAGMGAGIGGLASLECPPKNILFETKHEGDVGIVVVRQMTTRTSGYHTKPGTIQQIFLTARSLALKLV